MTSSNTELRQERPLIEILEERLNHALVKRHEANKTVRDLKYQIKKEWERMQSATKDRPTLEPSGEM